jgi:hypothetical protein
MRWDEDAVAEGKFFLQQKFETLKPDTCCGSAPPFPDSAWGIFLRSRTEQKGEDNMFSRKRRDDGAPRKIIAQTFSHRARGKKPRSNSPRAPYENAHPWNFFSRRVEKNNSGRA